MTVQACGEEMVSPAVAPRGRRSAEPCDAIAIVIAGAVIAPHGTIIVLVAGGGILAVIVWYGGGHWSGVIGDLAAKDFPATKTRCKPIEGRYQQTESFHRCLRFRHAKQPTPARSTTILVSAGIRAQPTRLEAERLLSWRNRPKASAVSGPTMIHCTTVNAVSISR